MTTMSINHTLVWDLGSVPGGTIILTWIELHILEWGAAHEDNFCVVSTEFGLSSNSSEANLKREGREKVIKVALLSVSEVRINECRRTCWPGRPLLLILVI